MSETPRETLARLLAEADAAKRRIAARHRAAEAARYGEEWLDFAHQTCRRSLPVPPDFDDGHDMVDANGVRWRSVSPPPLPRELRLDLRRFAADGGHFYAKLRPADTCNWIRTDDGSVSLLQPDGDIPPPCRRGHFPLSVSRLLEAWERDRLPDRTHGYSAGDMVDWFWTLEGALAAANAEADRLFPDWAKGAGFDAAEDDFR